MVLKDSGSQTIFHWDTLFNMKLSWDPRSFTKVEKGIIYINYTLIYIYIYTLIYLRHLIYNLFP